MYCRHCRTHLPDGARFCDNCGMPVTSACEGLPRGIETSPKIRARSAPNAAKSHPPNRPLSNGESSPKQRRARKQAAIGVGIVLIACAAVGTLSAFHSHDEAHPPRSPTPTPTKVAALRGGDIVFRIKAVSLARRADAVSQVLAPLDDGRWWLVVVIDTENVGKKTKRLDSDNIWVVAGKKKIKEAGDVVDQVNDSLGTHSMGDMIGTRVGGGRSQTFALVYKVPSRTPSYELVFDFDGEHRVDLAPYIGEQLSVEQLRPTASPTPVPSQTATHEPTRSPTPPSTRDTRPTATPTVRPTTTSTPVPKTFAATTSNGWEIEVTTATLVLTEWTTDQGVFKPDGKYLFIPITATNQSGRAAPFLDTARRFVVIDGNSSADDPKGWFYSAEVSAATNSTFGFDDPQKSVPEGKSIMTILVFDVPGRIDAQDLILAHALNGSLLFVKLDIPLKQGGGKFQH
jgi:hypothetical protein